MPDSAAASSSLATSLAGIPLRNPVMLAAGCCGTLHEFRDVLDLSRVGGLVTKSITPEAREGNPTHRILDAGPRVSGMINAIGLANPGVDAFVRDYLPRAAALNTPVVCSVAGFSIDDYVRVVSRIAEYVQSHPDPLGVRLNTPSQREGAGGWVERWAKTDSTARSPSAAHRSPAHPLPPPPPSSGRGCVAVELNVSCPNVKTGTEFGAAPGTLRDLVSAVAPIAHAAGIKVFVKLSPVAPEIVEIAKAAAEAGADALTVANTIPAMAIDVRTRTPRLANVTGGLSGPAVHLVAVRLIHTLHSKLCRDFRGKGQHLPIIGVGGVSHWEDAAEFILAGATAVQMGTALYADPRSPLRVIKGLEKWVRSQGATSLGELVGAVRVPGA